MEGPFLTAPPPLLFYQLLPFNGENWSPITLFARIKKNEPSAFVERGLPTITYARKNVTNGINVTQNSNETKIIPESIKFSLKLAALMKISDNSV